MASRMTDKTEKSAKTNSKTGQQPAGAAAKSAAAPRQNVDAGATRTQMLIGAFVVVLLIGVALWQFGFFMSVPAKPITKINNTTSVDKLSMPQAILLAELINKTRYIPASYQIRYLESADNMTREITTTSDGVWTSVETHTPIYTRTYLMTANRTVLCENNGESSACAAINESNDLWAEAQVMGGMTFPEKNQSARIWASFQKLINSSEFSFSGATQTKSIANRKCDVIAYRIGENNLTICLDDQYGVVLSQEMTYNQPYQQAGSTQLLYRKAAYKIEAQELTFIAQNIEAPVVENSTKAVGLATADDEEWAAMQGCQSVVDADMQRRCFKDSAISFNDVRFCEQNQNATARGDCVIKVATQAGRLRPELCEKAGVMKSECYANIAYLKNDSSYCKLVSDSDLRKTCEDALQGTASK